MPMNLWTYTARELQRRPGRTALTLLGIALGLAVTVATRLTIDTAHGAYRELADGFAGGPSLEVTAAAQGSFADRFSSDLLSVAGVSAAAPCVDGVVALAAGPGRVSVRLLGIDPDRAAALTGWPLRAGRPPDGPEEALIDAGLAEALGLAPGQPVRLWAATGPAVLRLAGVLQPRAGTLCGVLVVPLPTAARLLGMPGRVTRVQVLLAPGADPKRVRAEIARRLPAGLTVQPPGARDALPRATLLATEQGLEALGVVALVAAAFVILNTFLLNLGERRGQLATLRALGATPGQVTRLLLREAALLGLAGTVAGCAAGAALAAGLLGLMGQFLGVTLPPLRLTGGPFLLAALLGPGTAVAATLLPAWLAGRRSPLEALLARGGPAGGPSPRRLGLAALLLLTPGAVMAVGLCNGWFAVRAGQALLPPTLGLLLTGCVVALPLLTGPLLRLAGLAPLNVALCMARRQTQRQPTRTALTAGVLFLALTVAVAFGTTVRGVVRDLRRWYDRSVPADFMVRGSIPDTAFSLAAPLPESLAQTIRRDSPAAAVERLAFVPAQVEGRAALTLARTFTPGAALPLDLREGEEAEVRRGLMAGEVVLGTGLAERLGLHRGDTVTLATRGGPRALRVAGTAAEYCGGGLALYLEWETARRLLNVPGVHVFLVSACPGGAARLGTALRSFCAGRGLLLQSNAEVSGLIDGQVGRATGVLWALMALAFVVASLGIVNTLTMNVRDQTRELGVLRAVGLDRRGVYRVVLAQALLLWGVSVAPGAVCGVALAYLIHGASACWAMAPAAFALDGLVLGGSCVLALATAVLAALLPARRAARLAVVRAIRHA
jgi:putative ABC transport system permease protein